MTKREVLKAARFGKRIAEEEVDALAAYFVETSLYTRILGGEIDVIYGTKGSGKSAIYFSLLKAENSLFDSGILVKSGENPRGTPAFKDLTVDPPASPEEFRGLWKLYLLTLIGTVLRDYEIKNPSATRVLSYLEAAELLPPSGGALSSIIRRSLDYVRKLLRMEAVEGGLKIDPHTGLINGLTGKITLREPAGSESKLGLESVDNLCRAADDALSQSNYKVWILLDRLDVAFAESTELETRALRALFSTYLDFLGFETIRLKIFLRSDIWKRITDSGFRESSHITRSATITWNESSLLNLIIRRILNNQAIREHYGVTQADILADYNVQETFFYRVFPDKVDAGKRKAKTFDWMLSRTRDGLGVAAPRELIHLLSSLQDTQLAKFDLGSQEPGDEYLFDRSCFKEAMHPVSQVRTEQTVYAEYPDVKPWLEALRGGKTEHAISTLSEHWGVKADEAQNRVQRLLEIGVFEALGSKASPRYKIPFLYREYLDLVQGKADGVETSSDEEQEE
ncbi:MAG: hypothetical protein K8R23_09845 [Chthoniobacter sp.]|nr:hypothetical protein [Chthoniobacter sp.]